MKSILLLAQLHASVKERQGLMHSHFAWCYPFGPTILGNDRPCAPLADEQQEARIIATTSGDSTTQMSGCQMRLLGVGMPNWQMGSTMASPLRAGGALKIMANEANRVPAGPSEYRFQRIHPRRGAREKCTVAHWATLAPLWYLHVVLCDISWKLEILVCCKEVHHQISKPDLELGKNWQMRRKYVFIGCISWFSVGRQPSLYLQ